MDRRSAFIAAYLLVQLAAPLRYYLLRTDRYDERFAWRMFSPERSVRCEYVFEVDGRRLTHRAGIRGEFHEAWANLARRGRGVVIDAMAAKLCRRHPVATVSVRTSCHAIDGTVVTIRDNDDACAAG